MVKSPFTTHPVDRSAVRELSSTALSVATAPIVPLHQWQPEYEDVHPDPSAPLHRYVQTTAIQRHSAGLNSALLAAKPTQPAFHIQMPTPPTTMNTALSVFKESLVTLKDASDMFLPLKTALVGFLAVWDVYDRTADVQADFIELGSKLSALTAIVFAYGGNCPRDVVLQERLEAIAVALSQLSEAIMAKQERGTLRRAAESMGDLAIISIMFRRVTSLLEIFQFEAQIRAESLLVTILDRLDTVEQHNVTRIDAVQLIRAHMDQHYSSSVERYQSILNQLEYAGGSESVINNNSNRNEVEGPADLDNHNGNETQLEIDTSRGGGVVNNNNNVNRVVQSGHFSFDGGGANGLIERSDLPGGKITTWPRTRISNNNGNKSIVRRTAWIQGANSSGTAVE